MRAVEEDHLIPLNVGGQHMMSRATNFGAIFVERMTMVKLEGFISNARTDSRLYIATNSRDATLHP